jgi:prevent-host-death family protein
VKFVPIRELKINPSKVIRKLGKEGVVITRRGKPVAALTPLDEDLIDDYIFAHHPTLRKEVEEALAEGRRAGGVDHSTMKGMIERGRR